MTEKAASNVNPNRVTANVLPLVKCQFAHAEFNAAAKNAPSNC